MAVKDDSLSDRQRIRVGIMTAFGVLFLVALAASATSAEECPIGVVDASVALQPVCAVRTPSPVFLREFPNVANLTAFNCQNPTARKCRDGLFCSPV